MRLVCPNCGAQYEVDDRVMPEGGRDVQCSACGHAWFQRGPHAAAPDLAPEADQDIPSTATSDTDEANASAEIIVDGEPEDEPTDSQDTEQAFEDEASPDAPTQRELNPDVKRVLQEEAERELDARQTEQEQLETQTELGLDDLDPDEAHRQSVRERMARLRGAEDEFEATEALPEGRGRDLLPDIEEINSTLDASQEDQTGGDEDASDLSKSGGGFRRGFVIVVIFAGLLLGLYIYASAIGNAVPALKAPLDQFVGALDKIRTIINTAMESAISTMQGISDEG